MWPRIFGKECRRSPHRFSNGLVFLPLFLLTCHKMVPPRGSRATVWQSLEPTKIQEQSKARQPQKQPKSQRAMKKGKTRHIRIQKVQSSVYVPGAVQSNPTMPKRCGAVRLPQRLNIAGAVRCDTVWSRLLLKSRGSLWIPLWLGLL